MKKLLMYFVTTTFLLFSFSVAHAEDMSRSEVIEILPQFAVTLSAMQQGLHHVHVHTVNENNVLRGMSMVLGNSVAKLAQVQEPLSQTDQMIVEHTENELRNIEAHVSAIATRRQHMQSIFAGMINTLSQISNIFARAV